MPKLSGSCLCGAVSFEADGDIPIQANCHCTDCRQVTGATFATLLFMRKANVQISGEYSNFDHKLENGHILGKQFCPKCGSQMFGTNSARPGMVTLRAGSINEQELVKPTINVFAASKMDCTVLDPDLPAPAGMPG